MACPGCPHIPAGSDGSKDFSGLIRHALRCPPPQELETGELVGGFAHGQTLALADRIVEAVRSGAIRKFVREVPEITFNGREAYRRGQEVLILTERAVFRQGEHGLILTEIAPGIDLQRDVLDQMDFCPEIAPDLKEMDPRLFCQGPMGIREEFCRR